MGTSDLKPQAVDSANNLKELEADCSPEPPNKSPAKPAWTSDLQNYELISEYCVKLLNVW